MVLAAQSFKAGESQKVDTEGEELLVLPLEGSATVEVDGERYELAGRESIWTGVTDYIYIPRGKEFTLTATTDGRFALPATKAARDLPVRYCPIDEVNSGIRGSGNWTRQVNNYALGNEVETSHLLVTEVLTPGGNWSSYPPHKHDEHTETERVLEEIYYFEILLIKESLTTTKKLPYRTKTSCTLSSPPAQPVLQKAYKLLLHASTTSTLGRSNSLKSTSLAWDSLTKRRFHSICRCTSSPWRLPAEVLSCASKRKR